MTLAVAFKFSRTLAWTVRADTDSVRHCQSRRLIFTGTTRRCQRWQYKFVTTRRCWHCSSISLPLAVIVRGVGATLFFFRLSRGRQPRRDLRTPPRVPATAIIAFKIDRTATSRCHRRPTESVRVYPLAGSAGAVRRRAHWMRHSELSGSPTSVSETPVTGRCRLYLLAACTALYY